MAIAYLVIRFPAPTQTFIEREVRALCDAGLSVQVWVMHGPDRTDFPFPVRGFSARCLVELLWRIPLDLCVHPIRWMKFLWAAREYRWRGLENLGQNLWAVGWAVVQLPRLKRAGITHLHGAWASGPATAAWLAADRMNRPWSMGAHAFDIYRRGGDGWLALKAQRARWIHVSTEAARQRMMQLGAPPEKLVLVRRGLPELPRVESREPRRPPWRILSVARFVPKKHHHRQIEALRLLVEHGIDCELEWVGDGPLRQVLKEEVEHAGMRDRVIWSGELAPTQVMQAYARADLFWHTGSAAPDGDRDGLPNVIGEAMAHAVPVISSDEPGPNEAVKHEVTGLLVSPPDAKGFYHAARKLLEQPALHKQLGEAGRKWAAEEFMVARNVARLIPYYRSAQDAGQANRWRDGWLTRKLSRVRALQNGAPWAWSALVYSHAFSWCVGWLFQWFFRLRWTMKAPLPEGPVVFAGNHASHYDLFLMLWLTHQIQGRPVVPVAWSEMLDWPVIGGLLKSCLAIGVDHTPAHRASRSEALARIVHALHEDACVLILPEGACQSRLGPFKPGAALAAQRASVPLVPFTLRGVAGLFSDWRKFPDRMGEVEVIFHPAIEPGSEGWDKVDELTERLRAAVASALDYRVGEPVGFPSQRSGKALSQPSCRKR